MAKLSSINFSAIRKAVVADLKEQAGAIGKGWNGAELLAAKTIKRTWLRPKHWAEAPAHLDIAEYASPSIRISYVYSVGVIDASGAVTFLNSAFVQCLLEGERRTEFERTEKDIFSASNKLVELMQWNDCADNAGFVIAKVVVKDDQGEITVQEKSCRVYTRD